jgi:hypothetical protein
VTACTYCDGKRRVLYFGSGLYAVEKPCPECGDPNGPVLPTTVSAVREVKAS